MALPEREWDNAIAAHAGKQHRLITTTQLEQIGLKKGAVTTRVVAGRLHRVVRGVYAVGVPMIDPAALRRAGVLAAGPGSFIAYRAATDIRDIVPSDGSAITVCRPGRRRASVLRTEFAMQGSDDLGVITVLQGTATQAEIETVDGLPVTTLPRTLIDLAADDPAMFRKVWREAEYQGRLRHDDLGVLLRSGSRPGFALARQKLEETTAIDVSSVESPAELAAIRLLIARGAPPPAVNQALWAGGRWRRPNLYWALARYIVEIDGWAGHRSRDSFEDDAARDSAFLDMGILTERFTARRMHREPDACADQILRRLRERAALFASPATLDEHHRRV